MGLSLGVESGFQIPPDRVDLYVLQALDEHGPNLPLKGDAADSVSADLQRGLETGRLLDVEVEAIEGQLLTLVTAI